MELNQLREQIKSMEERAATAVTKADNGKVILIEDQELYNAINSFIEYCSRYEKVLSEFAILADKANVNTGEYLTVLTSKGKTLEEPKEEIEEHKTPEQIAYEAGLKAGREFLEQKKAALEEPVQDEKLSEEPKAILEEKKEEELADSLEEKEVSMAVPTTEPDYKGQGVAQLVSKLFAGDNELTEFDLKTLDYLESTYDMATDQEKILCDKILIWAGRKEAEKAPEVPAEESLEEEVKLEVPVNNPMAAAPEEKAKEETVVEEPVKEEKTEEPEVKQSKIGQRIGKIRKVLSRRQHLFKNPVEKKLSIVKALYSFEDIAERTEDYKAINLKIANFRLNYKTKNIETLNLDLANIDRDIANTSTLTIPEKKKLYKKLAKLARIVDRVNRKAAMQATMPEQSQGLGR